DGEAPGRAGLARLVAGPFPEGQEPRVRLVVDALLDAVDLLLLRPDRVGRAGLAVDLHPRRRLEAGAGARGHHAGHAGEDGRGRAGIGQEAPLLALRVLLHARRTLPVDAAAAHRPDHARGLRDVHHGRALAEAGEGEIAAARLARLVLRAPAHLQAVRP